MCGNFVAMAKFSSIIQGGQIGFYYGNESILYTV